MPIRLLRAGFVALSVTTLSAPHWPYFRGPGFGVVSAGSTSRNFCAWGEAGQRPNLEFMDYDLGYFDEVLPVSPAPSVIRILVAR
jgi:hypothetical protein